MTVSPEPTLMTASGSLRKEPLNSGISLRVHMEAAAIGGRSSTTPNTRTSNDNDNRDNNDIKEEEDEEEDEEESWSDGKPRLRYGIGIFGLSSLIGIEA